MSFKWDPSRRELLWHRVGRKQGPRMRKLRFRDFEEMARELGTTPWSIWCEIIRVCDRDSRFNVPISKRCMRQIEKSALPPGWRVYALDDLPEAPLPKYGVEEPGTILPLLETCSVCGCTLKLGVKFGRLEFVTDTEDGTKTAIDAKEKHSVYAVCSAECLSRLYSLVRKRLPVGATKMHQLAKQRLII